MKVINGNVGWRRIMDFVITLQREFGGVPFRLFLFPSHCTAPARSVRLDVPLALSINTEKVNACPLSGILFYAASLAEPSGPLAKCFITYAELCQAAKSGNLSFTLVDRIHGEFADKPFALLLLTHLRVNFQTKTTLKAAQKLLKDRTAQYEAYNQETYAFFSKQTGWQAADCLAERDVCIMTSASMPVLNVPVEAFIFSKFLEDVHDEEALEELLKVELDGRGYSQEEFIRLSRSTDTADLDKYVLALELAMAALTVSVRLFPYVPDPVDSYDVASVLRAGDCEDLSIVISMLGQLIKTQGATFQSGLLRAWHAFLKCYRFPIAFGGVTTDAIIHDKGNHARGHSYGNHMWSFALLEKERGTNGLHVPHSWLLEGTGHVEPSVLPIATRLGDHDLSLWYFKDQFQNSALAKYLRQRLSMSEAVIMGPTYPIDLSCQVQYQTDPCFYREPVGIIDCDKGLAVFAEKAKPRTFGASINDLMSMHWETRFGIVPVHEPTHFARLKQDFQDEAMMGMKAPPYRKVPVEEIEEARSQLREASLFLKGHVSFEKPISPHKYAVVRCSATVPNGLLFLTNCLKPFWNKSQAKFPFQLHIGVYGLNARYFEHENTDLILVQFTIGVLRTHSLLVETSDEWWKYEKVNKALEKFKIN